MKIYDVRGIGASLTGSFSGSFKGLFTGPLDGVAATSSYVEYSNVVNKPALVSGSSQVLAFNVFTTTGSNQFNGNQSITGSLTVSGQVIAQTLNVQQVTSSIVFSSGSNRFGNNSGNTHSFTGSVSITGSLTVNGSGLVPYTGATQDVNLGVYSIATNGVLANQITVNPSGTTAAQVFLKHGSSFSLPNGFGSIGSSTGNQFRLYQVSSEGVWRGANISLNSITSSATRTYTLPDADGTIALTSGLSAYLPLTGGTLTGALNGTSAVFSGNIAIGTNPASASAGGVLRLPFDNAIRWRNSSNTADVGFYLGTGNLFTFDSGISVTGAATFSSSVTAQSFGISNGYYLVGRNAANTAFRTLVTFDSSNKILIGQDSDITAITLGVGSEAMRITSGGYLKASNTGSYTNLSGNYHEFNNSVGSTVTMIVRSHGGTNGSGILCLAPVADTSEYFFAGEVGGTRRVYIYNNGNIQNTNNSYGAISDIKLKENIEDATPKLDDLMKVKVRNYNLIGDDKKQIGVIAQELEEVFPAMIDESEDFEEVEVSQLDEEGNEVLNEEGEVVTEKQRVSKGTSTKSVKYSVFVPMLIKAIQELKTEIDSLKNQMQ